MSILEKQSDIYFKNTREYFSEVLADYSIGNYRSSLVMLYSVVICDLLYKLQELRDDYNDATAKGILENVDKLRTGDENKSKSYWEWTLIQDIKKKTDLLDDQAFAELSHLYDNRCFSAHPACNDGYELIVPSQETTIAHIKNIMDMILVKPPVFAKNIIECLTEDIAERKDIFENNPEKFKRYLYEKYIRKMPDKMKVTVFKKFWKFCFCMPDNKDCMENLKPNTYVLELIMDNYNDIVDYIDSDQGLKSISKDETCRLFFCAFLSRYPILYKHLSDEIILCIKPKEDEYNLKAVAWYENGGLEQHLQKMMDDRIFDITEPSEIAYIGRTYLKNGLISEYCDYCVECYGSAYSYDCADYRFENFIEPNLEYFNASQFEKIMELSNSNSQIFERRFAARSNKLLISYAKNHLGADFDYSKYKNLIFDRSILNASIA